MKIIFYLLIIIFPSISYASGGGEAIIFLWALQIVLFFWPFLLPLFFIKNNEINIKSYLTIVTFIYGILGVLNIPNTIYMQMAVWFGFSLDYYRFGYATVIQVIAFLISIYILKKYSSSLANLFQSKK